MTKKLLFAVLAVSVMAAGCKEKVDPVVQVTSTLAGDATNLIAYTVLSGANEVPAVTTTATGTAVGTYNKTTKLLNLSVTYAGITPTAWHIHKAAAGATGGVVFDFGTSFATPFTYTSPALTAAQETDLLGGLNYVNIHSAKAPGGEIRGQLAVAATMATGSVSGTYDKSTKVLKVTVSYSGVTPTAWHIHKGAVGTSGPVILDMGTTFTSPFTFTTTALTTAQETDLLAGLYYVNIHSVKAPGGEIRGQLAVQ